MTTIFLTALLWAFAIGSFAEGSFPKTASAERNSSAADFHHAQPACHDLGAKVRKNVTLDGMWDVTQTLSPDKIPSSYDHKIPVPGLVDMASPKFDSTGVKCSERNYYWYRRFFTIKGAVPQVVLLKINKAKYGTAVYVNGREVGNNIFCFTPTVLDIRNYVKPAGEENELVIRVGTYDSVPDTIPKGTDVEKIEYLSGIYDDVEMILSNYPFINNVQIVPEIKKKQIKVRAEVESDVRISRFCMSYSVVEYKSGKEVVAGKTRPSAIDAGRKNIVEFDVPLRNCHLWSPEDPFLYDLNLSTGADSKVTLFGMRSFRFDSKNDRAILNGKPYMMLGTNICIFRFFEDSSRGDLPWNEKWVRKLFRTFKKMNCNCMRFCIGFPPEEWYRIADETGFLIQDEYPLWEGPASWATPKIKANVLIEEYTRWMRDRWNHPCVVIWDAQNESDTKQTGVAIRAVRHFDLSNRPWDNGWGAPESRGDEIEEHPYLDYIKANASREGYLKYLFGVARQPNHYNDANQYFPLKSGLYQNARVIDEYNSFWLNRDGSPTLSTDSLYLELFGNRLTTEQRRKIRAENDAIATEYWRCCQSSAGIMWFCGLGYSRPDGPKDITSDVFENVRSLKMDPYFKQYMTRESEPICIMIDKWDKSYAAGEKVRVPVYVINNLRNEWNGTLVLSLSRRGNKTIVLRKQVGIPSFGRVILDFDLTMPVANGNYNLSAETLFKDDTVKSTRYFTVN